MAQVKNTDATGWRSIKEYHAASVDTTALGNCLAECTRLKDSYPVTPYIPNRKQHTCPSKTDTRTFVTALFLISEITKHPIHTVAYYSGEALQTDDSGTLGKYNKPDTTVHTVYRRLLYGEVRISG